MSDPAEKEHVTVDLDSFSVEDQPSVREEILKRSPFPPFQGTIEHAYTKAHVGQTNRCPRCGAATQRMTANFVYATNVAPRAMLAPAGYFCVACPTVIIDEEFVATAMASGSKFRRVVAIDRGSGKRPDIFTTWNGVKPIYVLDENEQFADLVAPGSLERLPPPPPLRTFDREKARRKRKLAKQARRRNRR